MLRILFKISIISCLLLVFPLKSEAQVDAGILIPIMQTHIKFTLDNKAQIYVNRGSIQSNGRGIANLQTKLNSLKSLTQTANRDRKDGNKVRKEGNKTREDILKYYKDDLANESEIHIETQSLQLYKSLQKKHQTISRIYSQNVDEILSNPVLDPNKRNMIHAGFTALQTEADYLKEELLLISKKGVLQISDSDRLLLLKDNYENFNRVITLLQYWTKRSYQLIASLESQKAETKHMNALLSLD